MDEDGASSFNIFGTAFVMNEAYLSDATSWILPKPLLIDQSDEYKFTIGTQLGDAGTTLICENCQSAVKFYWPGKENEDFRKIQAILASSVCPLCGKVVKESEKSRKILETMTGIMAKFKYEVGQA